MTLTDEVVKNIIRKLLSGEDYRIEIVTLINAEFLQFAIDFFKKIIDAKLNSKDVTIDWYKSAFLDDKLPKDEIAINSGLNMKTIGNMFNSTSRKVVIDASNTHYDTLYESIKNLIEKENELELTLGRYDTPFYIKTEELMDKRLKHKFKHIHFVEASGANVLVNGKTAYECRNNRTKAELAIIFWYLPWKEYCFTQSAQGVIFNNTCLQDVQNFIEQLNAIEQN